MRSFSPGLRIVLPLALALTMLSCGDDDGERVDARVDAAVTADGGDGGGWPHCPVDGTGAPPTWAETVCPNTQAVLRCAGHDLHVDLHDDGLTRLMYVPSGEPKPTRAWALVELPGIVEGPAWVGEVEGDVVFCTADRVLRISPGACRLQLRNAAGQTLLDDGLDGGWQSGTGTVDGSSVPTVSVTRATPTDERFYGFGERNGPLSQRGRNLTFWNTDAYDPAYGGYAPNQDPLYQSIPFFIGLRGGAAYGVLTENAYRQEVDLAATQADRYTITAFGGVLQQLVIQGDRIPLILRRYSALTGHMPLPPRWALGYHQCRWGYAPASRLTDLATEFRARQIPADTLWLDIQHMDGFRTFTWHPTDFPDPAGLLQTLAGEGFRVTVIADPGIKLDPGWAVYDSGLAADAFLREPGGDVYVGSVWPGDAVFPDFTNPDARAWWGDQVAGLVSLGVSGVWLDVNEPTNFPESGDGGSVPNDLPIHGDGIPSTMAEGHNVYALHEAMATYEGMLQAAPDRRPFILSRAAYAGIQRYAAAWTGDAPSTWESLAQSLPMLLNMGLSGQPFVGSDVGGYSGGATPELFARWMSLGAVSPFFRGHVTSGVPDQEPWAFGQEVEDISRFHIGWRYELMPYLYSLFDEASLTGAPILRPLVYAYQDDPETLDLGDQALLGPNLMVAPVLSEGATTRRFYLPEGRWFEYRSGAVYEGPQWVELPVTLAALPRYVPEGAILPHGPLMQHTGEIPVDPLTLHVYPGAEETTFTLYEDAGNGFAYRDSDCYSRTTFRLQRLPDGARLEAAARAGACPYLARHLEIQVRRVDHLPAAVTLDGVALDAQTDLAALRAGATGWFWDEANLSLVIRFPDQNGFTLEMTYDPSLTEERPRVDVPLRVTVPVGTPTDTPLHIVTHVDNWTTHHPLTWTGPETAEGTVTVPRGEWFWFKYTRGDWDTVEKWPGCAEADDRYGFGEAHPTRNDTVFGWRDWCPP